MVGAIVIFFSSAIKIKRLRIQAGNLFLSLKLCYSILLIAKTKQSFKNMLSLFWNNSCLTILQT